MQKKKLRRLSPKNPEKSTPLAGARRSSNLADMKDPARGLHGEKAEIELLKRWSWVKNPGTLAAITILSLLSIVAFANTFRNQFVFDDIFVIVENRLIKQPSQVPELFLTDYWAGGRNDSSPGPSGPLYRPLVLVTYGMNYWIGGLDPFGYHLVNLFLHLAVTFFLYRLACNFGYSQGAALAAAALFAVHPIHTEAVTSIVGRAELLMAGSVLLVLSRYVVAGASADGPRWKSILLSLVFFAVGLLSKEQAMVLPALLFLADLSAPKAKGGWKDRLRGRMPIYFVFVLVLGVYLALRAVVLGSKVLGDRVIPFGDNILAQVSWNLRFPTAIKIAGKYLWLFMWPAKLSADYSYNAIPVVSSLLDPQVIWSVCAWGFLLGLGFWSYFRGNRRLFFAVGLTVLTFLPVSNLLLLIGTVMGERLFYLPSAGLCLMVGQGWDSVMAWGRRMERIRLIRNFSLGIFGLAIILLTARTMQRNLDWRTNESLFQSAVKVVPGSAKVHYQLGYYHAWEGNFNDALREYERTWQIDATWLREPIFNRRLGGVLLQLGRLSEAVDALQTSVRIWPKSLEAYYNLGQAYVRQGRFEEAETAFRRAIALKPEDADAHNSLSRLLIEKGRFDEAAREAGEAVRNNPKFVWARFNQAWALEGLGRLEEAAKSYEQALALDPNLAVARDRLQNIQRRLREG